MKFLSLFAGVGGLDLGLECAGFECVGQVEIEPFCQKVLAKHWPNTWRWNDIKTLTGEIVAANCGAIDLLCGGVPCQPASVAGRRKGAADDRWLWPDFLRLVSEIKPVWVLAENPRGVLSLPVEGMQFSEWIAREFATRCYELLPVELAAEDVGAPHRRERIFFVAYRASHGRREGRAEPARIKRRFNAVFGGSDVANTDLSQWGPPAREADERNGNDGGRQETASGFELCRAELANPADLSATGLPTGERAEHAIAGFGGEELANANELLDGSGTSGARGWIESANGHSSLGRADNPRLAQHAGQRSDSRKELSTAFGASWPARPGQPQHEWEEPRVVESPMGGAAPGLSERLARRHRVAALKALGNAIVPQVAEVIGRAILEIMEVS